MRSACRKPDHAVLQQVQQERATVRVWARAVRHADAVTMGMLSSPEWAEMNSPVFMHTVVPNLVKLGLISARTRSRWQELGMLTDVKKAQLGPVTPDLD